jgi:hypothetical protein
MQAILPPLSAQSPVKCPLPDIELASHLKKGRSSNISAFADCDGQVRQPGKYSAISQACQRIDKRCRAITDYEIAGRGRDQVQVRIEVTDRGSIRHAGFIFVRPATNRYSAEHAKEL